MNVSAPSTNEKIPTPEESLEILLNLKNHKKALYNVKLFVEGENFEDAEIGEIKVVAICYSVALLIAWAFVAQHEYKRCSVEFLGYVNENGNVIEKSNFCHKCGSKIEYGFKFCPKCGEKVF